MQVVRSSQGTITLEELRKHLEKNDGVLLWIGRNHPKWRFLKGPYKSASDGNDYSYGWVSLYFHRGHDNTSMYPVSSGKDLIRVISEQMREGDQFHWFLSEDEFILCAHSGANGE